MTPLVPIALIGWIPFVLMLFTRMPVRRAVVTALVFGWCFLPVAKYSLGGPLNFDKPHVVVLAPLLGVLWKDAGRLARFRLKAWDLPMLLWCVSPAISSLANDLGPYDALAQSSETTMFWGIPYVLGRIYFDTSEGLRELALGIVKGGLVYAPLCIWEARMSPQLHGILYGFHQHDFAQTMRGSGFRPTVFMQHGLMVGLWMCMSALIACAAWRRGGMRAPFGLSWPVCAGTLVVAAIACRSMGALVLLAAGGATLWFLWHRRSLALLVLLLLVPPAYVVVRSTGSWAGEPFIGSLDEYAPDRTFSLRYRLEAEDHLVARARERPVFGWGGWGRNVSFRDEEGTDPVISDGLWILIFGKQGIVGLVALLAMLLAPVWRFFRGIPARWWREPELAVPAALGITLACYMIDNLPNDMFNPVYALILGGCAYAKAPLIARREAARAASAAKPSSPRWKSVTA